MPKDYVAKQFDFKGLPSTDETFSSEVPPRGDEGMCKLPPQQHTHLRKHLAERGSPSCWFPADKMGNMSNASVFISTLSEREDLIFGTLYLVFGIVSLSGNTLLLLVAYRKRSMLKPAEFFIVNLAISDLSMTVTLFPLATSSFFAHRWLFNHAMCTIYAFCGVLFGLCSLTSLTVLSTVCCLKARSASPGRALPQGNLFLVNALVQQTWEPFIACNKFSPSHASILLLCVWAYALMFATAPLAEWGSYGPEPYGTACCITWKASNREAVLYILALFIFCYLLPCLLILVSYSLILWTVKGSRRAVRQHMSPQSKANGVHSLIVKLSIAVCLGFLAAWTPYAIVALWAVFGDASQVPALAFVLSAAFAKSSTLYNPLVYLLFKPNFQKFLSKDILLLQAIRTILCCGCPSVSLQPRDGRTRFSPGFGDHRGACRNCHDTFECFSNYPKCYKLSQTPDTSSRPAPLAILSDGSACQPGLKRTVQVMVLVTRKRSGLGAANVAGEVLPSEIMKDLL
ncbi:opsin-5-like isoform X3 [Apteryx rowi]|uniref:opsin-5-like isoform X3 n=1 Tax=Apteryx rowi TaxID=308060 RepID=UPI000E1C9218|nr:opsin-5-like isoform X3 [Apteryx rowi]XP_025937161.1 opsin-5-like isoform X3 [Apteryx rowi]